MAANSAAHRHPMIPHVRHPGTEPNQIETAPAPGLARRGFLKQLGWGAAVMTMRPWEWAMAGPFTRADFEKLVPADKKLTPEWVRSLTARGNRTVYRGAEWANIGMPIGGVCAGQVYLGGDGRLWHWDIFNRHVGTGAEHYAKPMKAASPLEQGFALRWKSGSKTEHRRLAAGEWKSISFIGEYPIGFVEYADEACPVRVQLEAYSPFIPLNVEDSSLPATILEFTLRNEGGAVVEGELAGWLENAVCLHSSQDREGIRRNQLKRESSCLLLACAAEEPPPGPASTRPDILVDDFEHDTYGDWKVEGAAFGTGPIEAERMPEYQGKVGARGKRLVNSHASAPGQEVGEKDGATGRLTSRAFKLERHYLTFLIGGGNHAGRTCMNLLVGGKVVRTATGAANNQLHPMSWDVRPWAGQEAQLEIVDAESGGWGNIGVDEIQQSDRARASAGPLRDERDYGSMALALLASDGADYGCAGLPAGELRDAVFEAGVEPLVRKPFGEPLRGSLARRFQLAPGAAVKVAFVVSWHFPHLRIDRLPPGRYYGTRFSSAEAVAQYVAREFARLREATRLWHDTWYDSSLPYWFLDRTFLNISILASSSCHRLGDGRFYSYEGVGCCEGTCGHVWHYAHAVGRIFPELERSLRERVDFGLALQVDGAIHFRGEFNDIPAVDAQAGAVLRALREHQMSPDDAFLRRNWPAIRKAVRWLMAKDENADGLIEGNQHNTLDTDWFGPVAWLSGLYLAALRAAESMAEEMRDEEMLVACRKILPAGQENLVAKLFNGEYFMNRVDERHLEAINSGTGCEIDQVMGQSWAFQVGLPRVLPEKETLAALRSLWRYNFTPDVGPYRDAYKAGRWYAMPGEAGLLMCSFPRADWDYAQAKGKGPEWAAGYFNECMNGFEYQAAGHMIWEGMVTEGLAVTRAVHDRYHAARRNPFNEIECGDHYVRSMASYGVYLAVCGFEYHGPRGHLGFAPRVAPEQFRAAFTAAEGWGTFAQQQGADGLRAEIQLKAGRLALQTLALARAGGKAASRVQATLDGRTVSAQVENQAGRCLLRWTGGVILQAGQVLRISLT